jgi:hypothetical protein
LLQLQNHVAILSFYEQQSLVAFQGGLSSPTLLSFIVKELPNLAITAGQLGVSDLIVQVP